MKGVVYSLPHNLIIGHLVLMTACQSPQSSTAAALAQRSAMVECSANPSGLVAAELGEEAVKSTLSYVGHEVERLKIEYVRALTGSCAADVQETVQGLVRLSDGSVYWINPQGGAVTSMPQSKGAFEAKGLDEHRIPSLPGARFIDGDDYMADRTEAGLEYRYLGLWRDGTRWTVATFTTADARQGRKPRPLFHSRLPLRGITFFPSVDTPAGQIWTVQEGPAGEVRIIAILWRHERADEKPGTP